MLNMVRKVFGLSKKIDDPFDNMLSEAGFSSAPERSTENERNERELKLEELENRTLYSGTPTPTGQEGSQAASEAPEQAQEAAATNPPSQAVAGPQQTDNTVVEDTQPTTIEHASVNPGTNETVVSQNISQPDNGEVTIEDTPANNERFTVITNANGSLDISVNPDFQSINTSNLIGPGLAIASLDGAGDVQLGEHNPATLFKTSAIAGQTVHSFQFVVTLEDLISENDINYNHNLHAVELRFYTKAQMSDFANQKDNPILSTGELASNQQSMEGTGIHLSTGNQARVLTLANLSPNFLSQFNNLAESNTELVAMLVKDTGNSTGVLRQVFQPQNANGENIDTATFTNGNTLFDAGAIGGDPTDPDQVPGGLAFQVGSTPKLQFKPDANFSTDSGPLETVGITTSTRNETTGDVTVSHSAVSTILVTPDPDQPSLTVTNVGIEQNTSVPIGSAISAALNDPSETLSVEITNIPAGTSFQYDDNGTIVTASNTGNAVTIPGDKISSLVIQTSQENNFTLGVQAISTEFNNTSASSEVKNLEVAVTPKPPQNPGDTFTVDPEVPSPFTLVDTSTVRISEPEFSNLRIVNTGSNIDINSQGNGTANVSIGLDDDTRLLVPFGAINAKELELVVGGQVIAQQIPFNLNPETGQLNLEGVKFEDLASVTGKEAFVLSNGPDGEYQLIVPGDQPQNQEQRDATKELVEAINEAKKSLPSSGGAAGAARAEKPVEDPTIPVIKDPEEEEEDPNTTAVVADKNG